MNEEWSRLKRSIGLANTTSTPANAVALKASLKRSVQDTVDRCRAERKRARELETPKDLSDAAVLEAARWTDRLPLRDYEGVLHLVPRLVNVVTVRLLARTPDTHHTHQPNAHGLAKRRSIRLANAPRQLGGTTCCPECTPFRNCQHEAAREGSLCCGIAEHSQECCGRTR